MDDLGDSVLLNGDDGWSLAESGDNDESGLWDAASDDAHDYAIDDDLYLYADDTSFTCSSSPSWTPDSSQSDSLEVHLLCHALSYY